MFSEWYPNCIFCKSRISNQELSSKPKTIQILLKSYFLHYTEKKRIGYRLLFAFLGFFKTRFWPIFCTGMQIISNRFIEMYISLFYLQREVCSVLSNFGHISGFLDLTLNCWNFLTRFFFWLLTKHQKAIWYGFHP